LPVTGETGPHYLAFTTWTSRGRRFKMNPPIRPPRTGRPHRRPGRLHGGMIITDHAPHSAEEKSRGWRGASGAWVGLETSFAALHLYGENREAQPEKLIDLMHGAPKRRSAWSMTCGSASARSHCVRLRKATRLPAEFCSMGRATPLRGRRSGAGACSRCAVRGRLKEKDL
jgi:dihydroorotase